MVILKEPVWVVGEPWYMYWMLLERFMVRDMFKSTLRSVNGSSVAFTCKSSVMEEVAGVERLSAHNSQPRSLAEVM